MGATHVERGTEYERFVQAIYQALLDAEGVENVDVKHNIKIQGNSGCDHQIDVYWEFRMAGQTYKTAVECKAFDKSVPVGRIRDFYGVLVDIPNLIGVFATMVGYQRGAKMFAKQHGISLKELRAPTDKDWKGRVKDIRLTLRAVVPTITDFAPRVSAAFLASIPDGEEVRITSGFKSDEPIIFDRSGTPAATYEELRQSLPSDSKATKGLKHFAPFPDHVFWIGRKSIDIDGVDMTYDVSVTENHTIIRGEDFAQAIIKDVASGELTIVDKDKQVRRPRI
ncbi:MAG: restriction endonuclease [Sphingomonadaceae bacterium]|nr:restriction endonuclease [Sphingomonadaceae bacterium]